MLLVFSDEYAALYPWAYMDKGAAATSMLTKQEIAGKKVCKTIRELKRVHDMSSIKGWMFSVD
jgi:hypothetical protein